MVGVTAQEPAKQRDAYEPRGVGTDAEVHTVAEPDLTRNASMDRKAVGFGEFTLVTISRLQEQ